MILGGRIERVVVALLAMLASEGLVPVWYMDLGLNRPSFPSGILKTWCDDSVAGGSIPDVLLGGSAGTLDRALEGVCPGCGRKLRFAFIVLGVCDDWPEEIVGSTLMPILWQLIRRC
jgi:hypothetical protein